ncbi:MAG: bifunctional (p)ppGpp synthetase/guanosine-3',5'-bis(diphosphate) 3'-pyrophosphohydrolase [Georgfuchsia sp.]
MAAVLPSSVAPGKLAGNRQADAAQRAELDAGLARLKNNLSTYLKPAEIERVEAAFAFGDAAHVGQFRVSGAPYISHPLAVAEKLAAWHLDAQAIIAALLHDVMEDTAITKQEIADRFGNAAAELVDGVSKIDRIENQSYEEAQAENFRKMLLAMARDVRVILIKLSDRLHNMQTLGAIRLDKRRRIAHETLDIYAPIANRLGLNTLYRELQELSFQHLYPVRYRVLAKAVKAARGNRREVVEKILQTVNNKLPEVGIEAEVMGREKHLYGIYRKMREKHLTFSQVLDIYGFRIIVKDVPTCYLVLGVLHGLYNPVPGKFKDYIAIPKVNGYQSLHTTLIGPFSTPVEAQIRTAAMHHVAESGVASHWLYKDDKALSDLQKKTSLWLQSLLELQSASGDSTEFLEHVKIDLFSGEVYVFTPAGKILVLPLGSTPVDFAYTVHTDIGNHCVACRINNELMPLRTELHNGDRVEIITTPHANPNPAWLGFVKSARARSNIRHYLKTQQKEASAALGERLLSQALRSTGAMLADITPTRWKHLLLDAGAKSKNELLTDIGLGTRLAAIVARRLQGGINKKLGKVQSTEQKSGPILIRGTEGFAVQLASCCRPIPGDPVLGLIRKGQGLMVHTHDCANIAKQRGDRVDWVDVEWEPDVDGLFDVSICALVQNQRGVLANLTTAIAEEQSNITDVSIEGDHDTTVSVYFTLQVLNRAHLARVLRGLRRIPEVLRIGRLKDREINHHH